MEHGVLLAAVLNGSGQPTKAQRRAARRAVIPAACTSATTSGALAVQGAGEGVCVSGAAGLDDCEADLFRLINMYYVHVISAC